MKNHIDIFDHTSLMQTRRLDTEYSTRLKIIHYLQVIMYSMQCHIEDQHDEKPN
jgi:hypothetical protein